MESRRELVGYSGFHCLPIKADWRFFSCIAWICFTLISQATVLSHAASFENKLQRGRLLLLGGGQIPAEIRSLFFHHAGAQKARIVLIPTGSQDAQSPEFIESFLEPWRQYSPQSIVVLHARDRHQANDPDFLRPLREATGVWIGGGVQARLADRYVGTGLETELQNLLGRDGIIAGTSAGAAVMTRVMIADGLRQPLIASGLDLFQDAIIDQHFSQRYRMARLTLAVQISVNRFGVGIDEGTGLLVHSKVGKVLGKGRVRLLVATEGKRNSAVPLLVRDYSPGETVNLEMWREAAGQVTQATPPEAPRFQSLLNLHSRIAPSLTYSLPHDPDPRPGNR